MNCPRRFRWSCIAVAVHVGTGLTPPGSAFVCADDGILKAPVRLVPSVSAVAPGAPFDVAIAYQLDGDWHIYWKNPGDSGAPPKADWKLPPGFKADPLRFPAPRRLKSGPDGSPVITYVLYGEPVLLAGLTAPPDLEPGTDVTIAANVTTLVCLETCLMEKQHLSITLPVVADASQVKPANAELFAEAAKRIPPEDGRGKFVTVTAKPSADSVPIGGSVDLEVTIDIKKGYHIQSNKPYVAGFVPTEVVLEPMRGIELGPFVYPKANERVDQALKMKLSEFAGQAVVKVPIRKVTDEATGPSLRLAGIVTVQACAEKGGQCYPPETVAWSATIALTGAQPGAAAAQASTADDSTEPDETAAADGRPLSDQEIAAATVPGESGTDSGTGGKEGLSLPLLLSFAFLGGIILNIMPCVWPVLSIKVLSFVQQAHDDPRRVLRLGILFGLGILVSFWLLGVVAVAAKSAAGGATWGTQFASPTFVIAIIVVLWVFGLSLFGVFEINLPGAASGKLSAASTREGYAGSFVKGMLATVLATPCTAPLLGPAVAAAFTQTGTVIMAAMTAIGLGMALPYTVLAANPAWLKFLPKPGPWMESFKQFTGFLLLGVVIWLLWVLGKLQGADGIVSTVVFMAFLGLAAWLYGKMGFTWSAGAKLAGSASVLGIALVGGWFAYSYLSQPTGEIAWVEHQPGLHRELAAQGHTVFVNYTAAWCTKCIIEKKTVIETDAVRRKLNDLNVVAIKADFTNRPDWMAEELKSYGRAGVPLDVILPAGHPDKPIVLPEGLTKSVMLDGLQKAGPSTAPTGPPPKKVSG